MMQIIKKEIESGRVQALPGPGEILLSLVIYPLLRGFVPGEGGNFRTKGHQLTSEYTRDDFYCASRTAMEDRAH